MTCSRLLWFAPALCLATFALASDARAADQSADERAAKSRALVKAFATQLKGTLVQAIKSDGPVSAISVCNVVAPEIAKEQADRPGLSLGRTALRIRNPDNAPDPWERAVLERFLAKAEQGANLATLEHHEVTTLNGKRAFRYMKAIPIQKPCLTCHGGKVDAKVLEAIKRLYPQDRATGFKLGELRGAFTVVQTMD